MNKKDSKKKQFIIFGLCSFLALVICMVTLVVTVKNLQEDTVETVVSELESKTPLTKDKKVLAEYISTLTKDAVSRDFVKINTYTDVSVDDQSIEITSFNSSGAQQDNKLFAYFKNQLTDDFRNAYPADYQGEFGKRCRVKPLINVAGKDITDALLTTGLTDENGEPVYNDDGTLVDAEYYYITLKVNPAVIKDTNTFESFKGAGVADVTEINKELSAVATLEKTEAEPCEYILNAKVNRVTDEIDYIEIKKVYNVSALCEFKNQLAVFGKKNIEFQYTVTYRCEYLYAGISFLKDEASLEIGEELCLNVNAVIENDSEYAVTFISSDESIATVDEMGYVKGVKSCDVPAVITVRLEYLGEIFTDECKVNVK